MNKLFHHQYWPDLTSSLYYYKEETIDQTDTDPDSGILWNHWITSENGDQGDWAMHPPYLTRIVMDRLTNFLVLGKLGFGCKFNSNPFSLITLHFDFKNKLNKFAQFPLLKKFLTTLKNLNSVF